jgi:hypothetical protein
MKTKTYTFTETEILALKEALTEYHFKIKDNNMTSPIFIDMRKAVKSLKEQFTEDYRNI